MRKIFLVTILIFALSIGFAVAIATAGMMKTEGGHAMEVTNLIGKVVKNLEGENLGVIIDFVKDSDGRISFAILSFGKYEDDGDGGRQVAIPFGALSCPGQDCILHSGYEQLASSPIFLSKDELVDRKTAENIYKYFGLQPYWTEEETPQHEIAPEISGYDYY